MIIRKDLVKLKSRERKVRLGDFAGQSPTDADFEKNIAMLALNTNCFGKMLTGSMGIEQLTQHNGDLEMIFELDEEENSTVALAKSGSLFFTHTPNTTLATFEKMPKAFFFSALGKGRLLLFGEGRSVMVTAEGVQEAPTHTVHHATMCRGRIFTSEKNSNKLHFSQWLEETASEIPTLDYGSIFLPDGFGEILSLTSFEDDVYAFGRDRIARIYVGGAQEDMKVYTVSSNVLSIVEGSAQNCGERIFFLSSTKGVCALSQQTARVVPLGFEESLHFTHSKTAHFDGFFAFTANLASMDGESCLVLVDTSNEQAQILFGCQIDSIATSRGKCIVQSRGSVGQVCQSERMFGRTSRKLLTSQTTDFGTSGARKVLKSMRVKTKYPLTVRLNLDKKRQDIVLLGSESNQTVQLGLPFDSMSFSLLSDYHEGMEVSPPMFEVKIFEGGAEA